MRRAIVLLCIASPALAQFTGPGSSQSAYIVPSIPQVSTTSVLTVGDSVAGYRFVGDPDGLGLFANGDGTFTAMINHEISVGSGIVRAHGATGAFVSRWVIGANLAPISGRDHCTAPSSLFTWNGSDYAAGTTAWGRFCSADLAAPTAYRFGALGTDARILLNGEEVGTEGRCFAHIASGPALNTSYQLPRLGRCNIENAVASPFPQINTVVITTDDTTPGELHVYIGAKTDTGSDIDRAGLTNGALFGVKVTALALETRATPASGRFTLVNFGNVAPLSGAQLQSADTAAAVTRFLRPEDGAWDPRPGHEQDFYFTTTDRFNSATQQGNTRLYRLRFDDITNPAAGGEITRLIDGFTDGPNMMDNLTIDAHGRVIIQEDIGGQTPLARVWMYAIPTGALVEIARHDPARFAPGGAQFLTSNEESSGVIDAAPVLGDGWFLLNVMAHYAIPGELVEGGQMLAMHVDPSYMPGHCIGDFNNDTVVDGDDVIAFFAEWDANTIGADVTGDGSVDGDDAIAFFAGWDSGC